MKQSRRLVALIMALAFAFLGGCASGRDREGASDYAQDAYLTTKIKAAILNEPNLNVSEINVETYKGVVQLSGFVSSKEEADRAVEVAREVKGVKSVQNDMRLKSQQP